VPIVALLVLLITERARIGSLVMTASWILGNFLAISIAVFFSSSFPPPRAGLDLGWEAALTFILGVGLLVTAVFARMARVRRPSDQGPPAWVRSADNLGPVGGSALALSNAMTSPKNLALVISAGRIISGSTNRASVIWESILLYTAVTSISLLVPTVIYFIGGERSVATLTNWRDFLTAHAAAIMEVLCLVVGIALSAKGLYNLLS